MIMKTILSRAILSKISLLTIEKNHKHNKKVNKHKKLEHLKVKRERT